MILILTNQNTVNIEQCFMFRRVQTESLLSVVAANSGLYTCMGCNPECVMNQTKLFVTTLPDGFHVQGPSKVRLQSEYTFHLLSTF